MKIEVFDPAMCCSTGVCGPSVPPALAGSPATWSGWPAKGVEVTRHNLAHEPQAFVASEPARTGARPSRASEALPLILAQRGAGLERTLSVPLRARRLDRACRSPSARVPLSDGAPASGSGGCCGGGGGC